VIGYGSHPTRSRNIIEVVRRIRDRQLAHLDLVGDSNRSGEDLELVQTVPTNDLLLDRLDKVQVAVLGRLSIAESIEFILRVPSAWPMRIANRLLVVFYRVSASSRPTQPLSEATR
jgi:hypothetical protein